MKRRIFLKASAAAALAAPVIGGASFAAESVGTNWFFYDDRFAEAKALAAQSVQFDAAATPVNGDVTQIWRERLDRISQTRTLSLEGVTTESFYFCLKTLMQSHARLETRIERVTSDLYAWSITSTNLKNTG